jgi:hypothetical protein
VADAHCAVIPKKRLEDIEAEGLVGNCNHKNQSRTLSGFGSSSGKDQ